MVTWRPEFSSLWTTAFLAASVAPRPSRIVRNPSVPRLYDINVSRVSIARCLLAVAVVGCAGAGNRFLPPSRPAEFSLAGIPWGISPDSVAALVTPRGYNLNKTDRDGDLWFDGMVRGTPTRIYAFIGAKKLVKFRMVMLTPEPKAIGAYRSARAELVRQYGQPKETTEEYLAPYSRADSLTLARAIKEEKATIRTDWLPTGSRTSHVSIEVTNIPDVNLPAVLVDYESAAWDKESLRRRQAH